MSTTSADQDFESSTKGVVAYSGTSFGGVMLAMVGIFQILEGIAAIVRNKIYVTTADYLYSFDVTTWGWIHLVLGVIAVVVSAGVLMRKVWGQVAGIVVAGLGALANFAFMPYYPFWSLVILAFYVFVIWALCLQLAHNDDF